jgi:ABC-type sugar transport system ATPase subunit
MSTDMIEVHDLAIRQGRFRLEGISLLVSAGRYAVLMGATGSGKTTILETIAGLRTPSAGRILLSGHDVTHLDPADRQVGYVPQDGALFRTMTVRDNLAFALTIRCQPAAAIDARVAELAHWLGVEHLLDRRAIGLSGGETQRIALGRALAHGPPVLLMDEPLGSLDEETRERLISVFRGIRARYPVTVLHVSHSRYEASALGDLVLRLQDGRVAEVQKSELTVSRDAEPSERSADADPRSAPKNPRRS